MTRTTFFKSRTRSLAPLMALAAVLAGAPGCSDNNPMGVSAAAADDVVPAKTVAGTAVRVAEVDLTNPHTRLDIGLANGADRPNQPGKTRGDEGFTQMVARTHPAVAINGTFFSEDAGKRVMGDMTRAGRLVKFSPWEDGGTSFVLHAGNHPEMITERAQGSPDRTTHWMSMTGGPRLLRDGKVYLHPKEEGFKDPDVFGVAARTALGFTKDNRKLMLVTFVQPVSLQQEAKVMQGLGLYQAMNLDGGTSQGLAIGDKTVVAPGRRLTNILAVYDERHPAPADVEIAWGKFQSRHPAPLIAPVVAAKPGDRWIMKLAHDKSLPYAGMQFKPVSGNPVVGVLNGTLAFSEGNFGEIFAPWSKPKENVALELDARVLDERVNVNLARNLSLELRRAKPAGLFLRKNGAVIAHDPGYVADRNWHHLRVEDTNGRLRVCIDGTPRTALGLDTGIPASGLGLAGRGEYRGIKLASLNR